YLARNQELSFLANALLTGASVYGRPFGIQEAWDAAVGTCNVGLEAWAALEDGGTLPDLCLAERDLVSAFEDGWPRLYQEVSLRVCDRLLATLADVRDLDSEVARDLDLLRRSLERDRAAGAPWRRAQDALEPLAILDTPSWAALCGLLSECPVLPDVVTALLGRRARARSAAALTRFSTRAQIGDAHRFAERLQAL